MRACVLSVEWCDAAGARERVRPPCLFAYVAVSVCRLAPPPLRPSAPPDRESLKKLPPALTFGPPARRPLLCVIFLLAFGGNGKQRPRLPGDAAAVTAEQQHGHYPQCPPYRSADSPHIPPRAALFFPSDSPTLRTTSTLNFQVVTRRHYLREIRRDQKVATLILPRPSAWDIINKPTSPTEFIYSLLSHVLTIR